MEAIILSPKVIDRSYLLKQVLAGLCSAPEAGRAMKLTPRQVFRLKARFKEEGAKCLVHGNRGRSPAHAIPESIKQQILGLAQTELRGANFTHFSELILEREKITVSAKTIGRILKKAGIAQARSHSEPRRFRRRKRRPCEGELVQMDASPFAWLEERGPAMSLHGAIDDATGKVLGLYFRLTEDTVGYLHVLKQILESGIPKAFYTDRHGIFVPANPGDLSLEEQLAGKTKAHTQFGKALEELNIEHIEALSPQAKGRVERLWGTLQDRLVIELRLANINTIEDANRFAKEFIPRFNQRFAVVPEGSRSAYQPLSPSLDLDFILSLRDERKAAGDSTISMGNTLYSLVDPDGKTATFRRRTPVQIRTTLHGVIIALVEGKRYSIRPWKAEQKQERSEKQEQKELEVPLTSEKRKGKKAWGRFCINPEKSQRFWQSEEAGQPGAAGPPVAK